MTVGITILVVILAFYLIALYCMLVASSTDDDKLIATEEDSEKKDKSFRIDALIIVVSVLLFSAGIVVGQMFSKTPETVVGFETTVSTAAPDTLTEILDNGSTESIMPETETTIHIEETEPTTEPTSPETPTEPESTEPEAPSAPVTGETTTDVDLDELEMLACVIYQEAGGNGSCDNCRRYVADVVLNRMAHSGFPNTMYEVLTQERQYGEFYWTGIVWPERAKYESEKESVARAYRIAEEVLSGQHSSLYGEGYIWQAEFVQGTDGFWCCGHYYGR